MTTRQLKFANIFIWGGVLLLVVGMGLSYRTFYPYFATLLETDRIPTAPPLEEAVIAESEETAELLPFEGEAEEYRRLDAALQPEPDTPTDLVLPSTPVATPTVVTTPEVTPESSPAPGPQGALPVLIQIPTIDLEAPVISIGWAREGSASVWQVPDWRAAGWHRTSAPLGLVGNTVLNGHNTTRGEVFRDLYKMEEGDQIFVRGEDGETYAYSVDAIYILQEAGQPLEVRLENARYIQKTVDERLTLVTCHPYGSTRHRLIVIARPVVAQLPE
ncbi:MAG: sortase [Anaerolineales bacterium]